MDIYRNQQQSTTPWLNQSPLHVHAKAVNPTLPAANPIIKAKPHPPQKP